MKKVQSFLLLLVVIALFTSCKKELNNDVLPSKSTQPFQSLYFDLKSNSALKIPNRFSSLKEAIAFMKNNFRQVNGKGQPYDTLKKQLVSGSLNGNQNRVFSDLDYPVEESTPNDGPTFGMLDPISTSDCQELRAYGGTLFDGVNIDEFCPYFINGPYNAYYDGYGGGSKVVFESILATYSARGYICDLQFSVKYAPKSPSFPGTTKMVYGNGNTIPTLQITGGAQGTMNEPQIVLKIYKDGTGFIHAYQVETRTAVYTNGDMSKFEFKPGPASSYPVGLVLSNGRTVTTSVNSITTYTLYYALTFYDDNVIHNDGSEYCDFKTGLPIMSYQDIGTIFVGVPRN